MTAPGAPLGSAGTFHKGDISRVPRSRRHHEMSFMRQRFTRYVALLGAVALSLSACTFAAAGGVVKVSSSSRSPDLAPAAPTAAAAYQLMRTSGAAALSVHITGTYSDLGQQVQLDVAGDRAGTTMRMLVNFGSGVIEILKVNHVFYLKADAAYWTRLDGSAAITKSAAGKYVKVPAGSAAGMGDFRVGTLLDQVLAEGLSAPDQLKPTVQTIVVDGVPAYLITAKTGDVTFYVSADGQGRLLRAKSRKSGTLDFAQWDSVVLTGPPPADQQASIAGP